MSLRLKLKLKAWLCRYATLHAIYNLGSYRHSVYKLPSMVMSWSEWSLLINTFSSGMSSSEAFVGSSDSSLSTFKVTSFSDDGEDAQIRGCVILSSRIGHCAFLVLQHSRWASLLVTMLAIPLTAVNFIIEWIVDATAPRLLIPLRVLFFPDVAGACMYFLLTRLSLFTHRAFPRSLRFFFQQMPLLTSVLTGYLLSRFIPRTFINVGFLYYGSMEKRLALSEGANKIGIKSPTDGANVEANLRGPFGLGKWASILEITWFSLAPSEIAPSYPS
ncbi:hypothetical protein Tco_0241739 [Tanacetum coccineum]